MAQDIFKSSRFDTGRDDRAASISKIVEHVSPRQGECCLRAGNIVGTARKRASSWTANTSMDRASVVNVLSGPGPGPAFHTFSDTSSVVLEHEV